MLGIIFEGIFQIVLEFLFEAVGEVVSEVGLGAFEKTGRSATFGPFLFGTGYAIFGGVLGGLSYFLLPHYFVPIAWVRIVGSLISPLLTGVMLSLVSWFVTRRDRGEGFWAIDKFVYGVVFGISYSIMRWMML